MTAHHDPFAERDTVFPVGNLGLRNIISHVDENGVRVITDAEVVYVSLSAVQNWETP